MLPKDLMFLSVFLALAGLIPSAHAIDLDSLGPIQVGFTLKQLHTCPQILIPSGGALLQSLESVKIKGPSGPPLFNFMWDASKKALIDKKSGLIFTSPDAKNKYLIRAALPFTPAFTPEDQQFLPSVDFRIDEDESLRGAMSQSGITDFANVPSEAIAMRVWQTANAELIQPLAAPLWAALLRQAGDLKHTKTLPKGLSIEVKGDQIITRFETPLENYLIEMKMMKPYLFMHVMEYKPGTQPKRGPFQARPGLPTPGIRTVHEDYAALILATNLYVEGHPWEKALRKLIREALDLLAL